MNDIEKKKIIDESELDYNNYFESLMAAIYKYNIFSEERTRSIQIELSEMLQKSIIRYNMGDSSSVQIETAQRLIMSIYYTIGVYLKSLDVNDAVECVKNEKLSDIYNRGIEIIKARMVEDKKILDEIHNMQIPDINIEYNDTISKGLYEFFKRYDVMFGSFDSPGSIDYPLCIDVGMKSGIEYMDDYLKRLYIENKFIRYFDEDEIRALLNGYDEGYKSLPINIYEIALSNVLGRKILGKNLNSLDIDESDRMYIADAIGKLSKKELAKYITDIFDSVCDELNMADDEKLYGRLAVAKISVYIYNNLELGKLDRSFITLREISFSPKIAYNDNKMHNSKLRHVIEEIRDCRYMSDKISIIKQNVSGIEDITEILNECFYGDECRYVFDILGDMELSVLLLMAENEKATREIYGRSDADDWHTEVIRYIDDLDTGRKKNIEKIKDDMIVDFNEFI